MRRALVLSAAVLLTSIPGGVAGQDIEMLGRRYGTPVPEGYRRAMEADPGAFEFRRAWKARGVDPALLRFPAARSEPSAGGPAASLGPRDEPVEGTYRVPVVLGLFENSGATAPFTAAQIQAAYFSAADGTITHYYDEVSGGRVELLGDVVDWSRAPRPDTAYTVGQSGIGGPPYPGLGGGGAWNFVWELLGTITGVNWGEFDNDGPDGVPNSGDDDGYVDVLAVIHPTRGGECGGIGSEDRIWSHRWSLSAPFGTAYTTTSPRTGGGFIRIDDYTIQPAIGCTGGGISEIGVFTHELGHAFGLPDLYDTNGGHSGAGTWDLMSSGSWGCADTNPERPCHMGAWTKLALGWVDVVTIPPDTDLGTVRLPPVETSDTIFRFDAQDGSGEYYLLENRQRIGYDQDLREEGLLIWQIDPAVVAASWGGNRVNAGSHMGVWLRQADGENDLGAGRGRGDAGDPFPGQTGNTAFHTVSLPSSVTWAGGASRLTLADIANAGDDVTFRLASRQAALTVRAEGTVGSEGLFTVDGNDPGASPATIVSLPFVTHELEVVGGEPLGPGARRPFLAWQDDPAANRVRTVTSPIEDTEYVAAFGGTQFELSLAVSGGVQGVEPGTFTSDPASSDLWFGQGESVSLTAVPRTGFVFEGWSGAFAGQGNPATFAMDSPVDAGADFRVVFAVTEATVTLPAATDLDVQLEVEQGTAPVRWSLESGSLPVGVALSAEGRLTGASLDVGRFDVTLRAVDASGLPATGTITLELSSPVIEIERLVRTFLLGGQALSPAEINFLNRQGNRYGTYDIGDLRAWLLAHPELPWEAGLDAASARRVHRATVVVPSTAREGAR
jgi:M6 family metalloprotease-like protein